MLWMFKEPLHKSIIVYLNYNYHLTVAYGSTPVNLELFKIKKKTFITFYITATYFGENPAYLSTYEN